MKLKCDDIIKAPVATYIGTLTWIDWENNQGKALLDAKPGEDPVEVDCTFRYMGQHWIWNMDAYPNEDAASHSAFAFCVGDRVILLHKDKKKEPGQQTQQPQPGDPPPSDKEYVGVAVLREEDDGQGGKITSIWKRKVWPLYRIGHESLVLDFKYAGLDNQGAGFPFLSHVHVTSHPGPGYAYYYDGRRNLENPFIDQKGHERAFGTPKKDGGWGNPRLVVTRERDENDEVVFIPHAIHEFCEADENIPYVPDVLMQTKPNYRGRIIGWSMWDEILIDNIPICRVASEDIEAITPSWKATTKRIIHIDEKSDTLTVLFVTVDCNYDWRTWENSGGVVNNGSPYWYPPKYAFYVQAGSISELCIYAAMETPRNELPVIHLQANEEASWLWRDLRAIRPMIYMINNNPDNLSDGREIISPGEELEVFFWAGIYMQGFYLDEDTDTRRKIGLTISANDDGSIKIEKKVGDQEPYSPISKDNLESYVRFDPNDSSQSYIRILKDYARIKKTITQEAARLGDAVFSIEMSGIDDYDAEQGAIRFNTDLRKAYRHRSPDSDFIVAEEVQQIQGEGADTRVTTTMIVFTHIDLRGGVYGYWEVTWFENFEIRYMLGTTSSRPPYPCYVKWKHFVSSSAYKAQTHNFEFEVPFCLNGPYNAWQIGNGEVPDDELERMEKIRWFSWFLQNNYIRKSVLHNVWDLPRLYEDDRELGVLDHFYRFPNSYDSFTFNPINYISEFLMYSAPNRGTKRCIKILEYEFTLTGASTCKPHTFDMHPFPNKDPGMWPHFRNFCHETPSSYMYQADWSYYDSGVNGVLFSESMEFDGAALGFGEFAFAVRLKKEGEQPVRVASPGMEKLLQCTGRNDATISLE